MDTSTQAALTQFVELSASGICTNENGDQSMKKASRMLEQGVQAPSPATDLISAEDQPSTANGGTSITQGCMFNAHGPHEGGAHDEIG